MMNVNNSEREDDLSIYLQPTYYIDYMTDEVSAFADSICSDSDSTIDKAVKLYYRVRDDIRYDPYDFKNDRANFKASSVIKKMSGYCVAKAILLAAVARYHRIPARLGFADVKNHLSTSRLRSLMKTDVFKYHGYVEMLIEGKWIKATPAFNLTLCTHFNVKPLEFDGVHDSIFHEYDNLGNRHMEYLKDYGHFADLPFDTILSECMDIYPGLLKAQNESDGNAEDAHAEGGDFHQEALEENMKKGGSL